MKIQIIEDETLQDKADFENAEVWLLSKRQADSNIDSRLVVVRELVESEQPSCFKLPQLMTEIYNKHDNFEYEVLSRNKENFAVKAYVCDESKIRIISDD